MADEDDRRSPAGEPGAAAMKADDARAVGVAPEGVVAPEAVVAPGTAPEPGPRDGTRPELPPARPVNPRSPFYIGLVGAAGVATTYFVLQLLVSARQVLVLVGLGLFLAIGLDPAVRWLGRWMPRWAGVVVVTLGMVLTVGGFLAAAIPPLASQATAFAHALPHYLNLLQDRSSTIGRLNKQYHLEERLTDALSNSSGSGVFGSLVGAGQLVLSATAQTLTVIVLTVYFLYDLPRFRRMLYRLIPRSRRERAVMLGDEMFAKVGGFVLGNLITSGIAGIGTFAWLVAWGIPYPLLLSLMVALLDLIPVVGSTTAGIIVTLVALTVSLPVAVATLLFYVAYRLAEDYLIVPRVIGKVIEVPATVTLVAVLLGGAVLGIVGALVAIPVAASIRIILLETVFPRLDRL